MARNRKNQSAAVRFGPAVNACVLCLLVGGSGIGYVWQKNQIYDLGQQIKKREINLSRLQEQNEKLSKQLAQVRTPAYLLERIEKLNLGLGPPQPGQVFRLDEPPRESADPGLQFPGRTAIAKLMQPRPN